MKLEEQIKALEISIAEKEEALKVIKRGIEANHIRNKLKIRRHILDKIRPQEPEKDKPP